ncbi:hypothetical protein [Neolewinella litorea]|uniref:hypothetical protein n=1 Tax=Neolewinella litorea TaxID=2562452 RepID=UPI001B3BC7D4|nr:hypothetical protein [Neolewinella litorea]
MFVQRHAIITTLTLIHYSGIANRIWALSQMQLGQSRLAKVSGLSFSRLMGSGGGNGFSLLPNFGVFALVGEWKDRSAADDFFGRNEWYAEVSRRSDRRITFFLEATMAHGAWGGDNPFTPHPDRYDPDEPVAVITRATIYPSKLPDFWRYVPATSRSVDDYPERRLSVGIGEYPVFMQATFSVWTSGRAMTEFAYAGQHHRRVVALTRRRGWYKEELFSRFRIREIVGKWPDFSPPPGVVVGPHFVAQKR